MGLTAVAGLGITTLPLRTAAAASSGDDDGDQGGGTTMVASLVGFGESGNEVELDVNIWTPPLTSASVVRIRIEGTQTWSDEYVGGGDPENPQRRTFGLSGENQLAAGIQDGTVRFIVGLFEVGTLVRESAPFAWAG